MDKKRVYCNIEGYRNLPTIHLSDIEVFEKMVNDVQPECIFVDQQSKTVEGEKDLIGRAKTSTKAVSEFSFFHEGLIYAVDGLNYNSLEDYHEGTEKGFASGSDYYKALSGNFIDKGEYDTCVAAGFEDRIDFLKAQTVGYVGSVDKLTAAHAEGKLSDSEYKKVKDFPKDADVYSFAQEAGYESYSEFENALASGFLKADATEYREAVEKGFDDSESYYQAKEGSFKDSGEFAAAQSLGISDKDEYQRYQELESLRSQYGFRTVEQAHLFTMLAEMPAGRKMSVAKIWESLTETQEAMRGGKSYTGKSWLDRPIISLFGGSSLPSWYTTAFKDLVELKVFLISNESVAEIGTYDADGEVFERKGAAATEAAAETVDAEASQSEG